MMKGGTRSKAFIIEKSQPVPKKLLLLIESAALVGDLQRALVEIFYSETRSISIQNQMESIQLIYEESIELKIHYEKFSELRDKAELKLNEVEEHKKIKELKQQKSAASFRRKAKDPQTDEEIALGKEILKLEEKLFKTQEYISWQQLEMKCKSLDADVSDCENKINDQYAQILFGKKIDKKNIPTEISSDILQHFKRIGIDIIVYRAPAVEYPNGREVCELKEPDALWQKIQSLPTNTHYPCIVIGGGHGAKGYYMSGFDISNFSKVLRTLSQKKIHADLICLGSCQGISFSSDVSKLLAKDESAVVSYVENCSDAFIYSSIQYLLGKSDVLIGEVQAGQRNELPAIHFKNGKRLELEKFDDYHFIVEGSLSEAKEKMTQLNAAIAVALPAQTLPSPFDLPISTLEESTLSARQDRQQVTEGTPESTPRRPVTPPKIF